jgi:histidyl-tRNA synthetase
MAGPNAKVSPKTLKGFRDYGPEEARLRKHIIDTVWGTALERGFEPLFTPAIEYAETLLGSGGEETDKEVYRFMDQGDRQVALRFDLTVPFARFVAENAGTLPMPFKKVQFGDVWRGEKPQKGRYREFCQADLDIVGVDGMLADLDIVMSLFQILERLIPVPFTMRLNHRGTLTGLMRASFGPNLTQEVELKALVAIDKLAKIGVEPVSKMLADLGFQRPTELLGWLDTAQTPWDQAAGRLRAVLEPDQAAREHFERFATTLATLQKTMTSARGKIVADLSIARGLGYYTGLVFETTIDQLPNFGSVSSGGRYNELVSRFTNQEIPGIGGSVGVDRLLAALLELNPEASKAIQAAPQVYVAVATTDAVGYACQVVESLRGKGVRATLNVREGKIGNQFKLADRLKIPFVLIVGTEEREQNKVSLKEMSTAKEEKMITLERAVDLVHGRA